MAFIACNGTDEPHQNPPADPSITSFTAETATITQGASTTLTAVFRDGDGSVDHGVGAIASAVPVSTGALQADTTFRLMVTGPTGTTPATSQVTVHVAPVPSAPVIQAPDALQAGAGGYTASVPLQAGMTFEWTIAGGTLTAGQGTAQITFAAGADGTLQLSCRAVNAALAASAYGTVSIPVVSTPQPEILAFSASPSTIGTGQSSTLAWTVANAQRLSLDQGLGEVTGTDQIAVQPTATTTYTLTATGGPGTTPVTRSVTVTLQAGLSFQIAEGVTLDLAFIPKGTFTMGSASIFRQKPHPVTLSQDAYMGVFLVTQKQYQALMGTNPSSHQGDESLPVENVTWSAITQAGGFLEKLNAATANARPAGLAFRLPTDAEWEHACRAGTLTDWYFGADDSQVDANAWCHAKASQPVGRLLPNGFGLYDMVGNVQQWCADELVTSYASPGLDPLGPDPAVDGFAAIRGGSFDTDPFYAMSSVRTSFVALASVGTDHDPSLGFRVILAAPLVW